MKKLKNFIVGLLLLFAIFSCEDLDKNNLNQPTFNEINLLAQVNNHVGTLFNSWFSAGHYTEGENGITNPLVGIFAAADVGTSSWSSFGWKDLSSEPRVAYQNTSTYYYRLPFESYYKNLYSTIHKASDALHALSNNVDGLVEEPERAKACAKFVQATCLGSIGLLFNQGFVVTQHTDIDGGVPLVSFDDILDSALNIMDDAIAICENSNFTIPEDWLPTPNVFTNIELGQLANTMAARLLVYRSRNSAQNRANDWAKVKSYAEKGIDFDFDLIMDDKLWRDYMKAYSTFTGFARIDMRIINMMDPNMPPWFPASGDIADLPNNGKASSDDNRLETDFEYWSSLSFRPDRGIYHFSTYQYKRFNNYLATWTVPVAVIRKAENDMLLAEAMVRTGDLQGAASVLNNPQNSRKLRGGLGDVEVDEQKLLDAIFYEKQIECILTGECVEFYDMRRNDLLQAGTFLHLPIPAEQLEIMQMESYSFGGTSGVPGEDYSIGGWETKTSFNRPSY